jgi:hypothetical protein
VCPILVVEDEAAIVLALATQQSRARQQADI